MQVISNLGKRIPLAMEDELHVITDGNGELQLGWTLEQVLDLSHANQCLMIEATSTNSKT